VQRPPRSSDSATPRRQFLRRTAGAAATAGLAATAGCLGGIRDSVTPPAAVTVETDATSENSLSAAELGTYAERQQEQYGDHGVWGTAGTEPDHDLSFVGAWTESLGLGEDGQVTTNLAAARASVDAAAALYRTGTGSDSGTRYQLWLWAAGRLPGEQADGRMAPTRALRRIEVGVTLAGDSAAMGPYSPASDRVDGPVSVGPTSPGYTGITTSFPLDTGTVRPTPERTGFDQNAYAVQWRGDADTVQSVNATCEATWPAESEPAFLFDARLAADRRRF